MHPCRHIGNPAAETGKNRYFFGVFPWTQLLGKCLKNQTRAQRRIRLRKAQRKVNSYEDDNERNPASE